MEILDDRFFEIAVLLLFAAVAGFVAVRLKQPLIVAFIVVGILVGPSMLGWVSSPDQLHLLAELGIALLLFVVGLKLDLHLIRTMGPVALATGLGQVIFTSVFGYLIALALGMEHITALYVAVALTFSSTIIIVKLLSDKREIDALHGRIAVGFLIVQDIAVIVAMIVLSAIGADTGNGGLGMEMLMVLLKGVGMLIGVGVLMQWALPWLVHRVAQSMELLVLFAIAWAVALAAIGDWLGFSKEVGAFLAGMSLASTPYRDMIGARLVSLRDFLLLFFFLHLGSQLELQTLGAQVGPAVILSAFVLIGNPLIVMVIMGFMGYRKRTSFLAGLTVAQISEFSLILAALGMSLGHIDRDTVGLVTLVGLITIGLSTYMILYSRWLYERLAPWLGIFEREITHREQDEEEIRGERFDAIVFGLGRYGGNIVRAMQQHGLKVFGVDFDPQAVARWRAWGLAACYGDAEDPEFPTHLPLEGVRWVISSLPEPRVSRVLLKGLRQHGYQGAIVLTAHTEHVADSLTSSGATRILAPFADAADQAVESLLASDD
jgi:Kef-type K+ transport system membrane component KefB